MRGVITSLVRAVAAVRAIAIEPQTTTITFTTTVTTTTITITINIAITTTLNGYAIKLKCWHISHGLQRLCGEHDIGNVKREAMPAATVQSHAISC